MIVILLLLLFLLEQHTIAFSSVWRADDEGDAPIMYLRT